MECKIKDRHKLISDYLIGELPDDDAKVFEEHYFQCETCFKELKIAEDAINIIAKEGTTIFEPEAHQPLAETDDESSKHKSFGNITRRFTFPGISSPTRWGIALVTVAAVVAIFLIIFINRDDQQVSADKIISRDEESQNDFQEPQLPNEEAISDEKDVLAELTGPAFKPQPYLEEWINENVRSGSEIIDTVFSPFVGEKFYNKEIIFKWKMNNDKPASFKILSNVEQEIFIASPEQSQNLISTILVDPNVFKQSGLYYWRIEDENEVLYVGKFYFLKQ